MIEKEMPFMIKINISESVNNMADDVYDNVALLGYACALARNDLHHIQLNAVGEKFSEIHTDAETYMYQVAELNDFCLELAKEGGLSLYSETNAYDVIKDSGNDWKVEDANSYTFEEAYTAISNILSDLTQFIKIITELEGVASDVTSVLDNYSRDFTKAVNYTITNKLSNDDILVSQTESTSKTSKHTIKEYYLSNYEGLSWLDEHGIMGEPGETYTFNDLKNYWGTDHEYDPCMSVYDNFEDWFFDTIGNMTEL